MQGESHSRLWLWPGTSDTRVLSLCPTKAVGSGQAPKLRLFSVDRGEALSILSLSFSSDWWSEWGLPGSYSEPVNMASVSDQLTRAPQSLLLLVLLSSQKSFMYARIRSNIQTVHRIPKPSPAGPQCRPKSLLSFTPAPPALHPSPSGSELSHEEEDGALLGMPPCSAVSCFALFILGSIKMASFCGEPPGRASSRPCYVSRSSHAARRAAALYLISAAHSTACICIHY